jgi:hypothetical protein
MGILTGLKWNRKWSTTIPKIYMLLKEPSTIAEMKEWTGRDLKNRRALKMQIRGASRLVRYQRITDPTVQGLSKQEKRRKKSNEKK